MKSGILKQNLKTIFIIGILFFSIPILAGSLFFESILVLTSSNLLNLIGSYLIGLVILFLVVLVVDFGVFVSTDYFISKISDKNKGLFESIEKVYSNVKNLKSYYFFSLVFTLIFKLLFSSVNSLELNSKMILLLDLLILVLLSIVLNFLIILAVLITKNNYNFKNTLKDAYSKVKLSLGKQLLVTFFISIIVYSPFILFEDLPALMVISFSVLSMFISFIVSYISLSNINENLDDFFI